MSGFFFPRNFILQLLARKTDPDFEKILLLQDPEEYHNNSTSPHIFN